MTPNSVAFVVETDQPIPTETDAAGRWTREALRLDEGSACIFRYLAAKTGVVVPAATLMALHSDGADLPRLLHRVSAINVMLADQTANTAFIVHYPEHGFALLAPPGDTPRPPAARAPLYGRDDAVTAIAATLAAHRFVTIVGPGGIGKTSVARVVAERLRAAYPHGTVMLDLSAMGDGRFLPSILASELRMAVDASAGSMKDLAPLSAFLQGRKLLVVLDSCEHVTDWAATAAEALLRASPGVAVIATSREALRADGEWVHRLGPVALAPADVDNAAIALESPAVQLFVARTYGRKHDGKHLPEHDITTIAQLCRELDGLPLAIELAAALVAKQGLRPVAAQMRARLRPNDLAPAAAQGVHMVMAGVLEWSYSLLSQEEQAVFRRLAVFRGGFTLADAASVVAGEGQGHHGVADTVVRLMEKSLVSADPSASHGRHRLLDTTRAFALGKLSGAEAHALGRAHANFVAHCLERAHADWGTTPRVSWLEHYSPLLDDVRGAMAWAFGDDGDALLGANLAAASFPLADHAGSVQEFGERVEQALAVLHGFPDAPRALHIRLAGYMRDSLRGPCGDVADTLLALNTALEEADATGQAHVLGAPLTSLWGFSFARGDYPASLHATRRIGEAAARLGDPYLAMLELRTGAQSLHFLGRHAESEATARTALDKAWRRIPLNYGPSPIDMNTSMRIILARVLWMQGASQQAAVACAEALACARSDRPVSLCQVYCLAAIPLTFWERDLAACERLIESLAAHAQRYSFGYWLSWANHYRELLAYLRDDGAPAPALARLPSKLADHFATFDTRLVGEEALMRMRARRAGWCAPEVMRCEALRLHASDSTAAPMAAGMLREAIALAREQGALAWEQRCAVSLASVLKQVRA